MLGWALLTQLSLSHFCTCDSTRFTAYKLGFGGVCSLVYHQSLI